MWRSVFFRYEAFKSYPVSFMYRPRDLRYASNDTRRTLFCCQRSLWRCTNPSLTEQERQRLVHDLMDARRDVKEAKRADDLRMLSSARARVNAAKVELGERGPVWWDDGSPDYNRCRIDHSPYADWYNALDATKGE